MMRPAAVTLVMALAAALGAGPVAEARGSGGHGQGAGFMGAPPGGGGRGPSMTGVANPSAVIGAEIALAQRAKAKGQWAAFRETSGNDAIVFVPGRVAAAAWLKAQPNPPTVRDWQVHAVWMSCDGSYAVARGAWQQGSAGGVFSTLWQRQPRQGDYKWLLNFAEPLASAPPAPEMIAGHVAECTNRPRRTAPVRKPPKVPASIDAASAQSDDGTLRWTAAVDATGAGSFTVSTWNGKGYDEAEHLTLAPHG